MQLSLWLSSRPGLTHAVRPPPGKPLLSPCMGGTSLVFTRSLNETRILTGPDEEGCLLDWIWRVEIAMF